MRHIWHIGHGFVVIVPLVARAAAPGSEAWCDWNMVPCRTMLKYIDLVSGNELPFNKAIENNTVYLNAWR